MTRATLYAALLAALASPALGQQAQPGGGATDTDEFLRRAIADNAADVEAGRLAQSANTAEPVRSLGETITRDSLVLNAELARLAGGREVSIAGQAPPEDRPTIDRLAQAEGAEFGRQYLAYVIDDLEQDVGLYREAARNVPDSAVKQFAEMALPILERNLATARQVRQQQALGGPQPERPSGPVD